MSEEKLTPVIPNSNHNGELTTENFTKLMQEAFLEIFSRTSSESTYVSKIAKRFSYPFSIAEELINKINEVSVNSILKLPLFVDNKVKFSGEVRFTDLSTINFSSLKDTLNQAAEKRDPQSLTLTWSGFLREPLASSAIITIELMTERPLETQELSGMEQNLAHIQIVIGGPSRDWAENVLSQLSPIIEVTKISSIYRPLMYFRNRHFVQIFSFTIAAIIQILATEKLSQIFRGPTRENIGQVILKEKDIISKFDYYIKYIFIEKQSLIDSVAIFGGSLLLLLLTAVLGMIVLPKLVPRSSIQIGLSKYRYASYQNNFSLLFVTIGISGLLLPLIRKIIGF